MSRGDAVPDTEIALEDIGSISVREVETRRGLWEKIQDRGTGLDLFVDGGRNQFVAKTIPDLDEYAIQSLLLSFIFTGFP